LPACDHSHLRGCEHRTACAGVRHAARCHLRGDRLLRVRLTASAGVSCTVKCMRSGRSPQVWSATHSVDPAPRVGLHTSFCKNAHAGACVQLHEDSRQIKGSLRRKASYAVKHCHVVPTQGPRPASITNSSPNPSADISCKQRGQSQCMSRMECCPHKVQTLSIRLSERRWSTVVRACRQ
jgi:hypothetical protein